MYKVGHNALGRINHNARLLCPLIRNYIQDVFEVEAFLVTRYSPFFYYSPMSLVRIKKST
jgi:hypothetical protein